MKNSGFEYTVALTSCGRFDLLRGAVESFLRFADIPPVKFIIVEDSGDDSVRDVLADLDFPFEFIINRPRLGQAKSIDAMYSRITTPFVFHCEDDWEFFRTGFIAESLLLLNKFPKVSLVHLQGRAGRTEFHKLPAEELNGVRFVRTYPKMHPYYWGYGFPPGLRRLSDYRRVAPFSAIGGEREVSVVFKRLGFYTAYLEIPAVCHLGWGKHLRDAASPSDYPFFQRKIMRYKKTLNRIRWRFGKLPAKWTDGEN